MWDWQEPIFNFIQIFAGSKFFYFCLISDMISVLPSIIVSEETFLLKVYGLWWYIESDKIGFKINTHII